MRPKTPALTLLDWCRHSLMVTTSKSYKKTGEKKYKFSLHTPNRGVGAFFRKTFVVSLFRETHTQAKFGREKSEETS